MPGMGTTLIDLVRGRRPVLRAPQAAPQCRSSHGVFTLSSMVAWQRQGASPAAPTLDATPIGFDRLDGSAVSAPAVRSTISARVCAHLAAEQWVERVGDKRAFAQAHFSAAADGGPAGEIMRVLSSAFGVMRSAIASSLSLTVRAESLSGCQV